MAKRRFLFAVAFVAAILTGISLLTACEKEDEVQKDGTEQTDNTKQDSTEQTYNTPKDSTEQTDNTPKGDDVSQGYFNVVYVQGIYTGVQIWREPGYADEMYETTYELARNSDTTKINVFTESRNMYVLDITGADSFGGSVEVYGYPVVDLKGSVKKKTLYLKWTMYANAEKTVILATSEFAGEKLGSQQSENDKQGEIPQGYVDLGLQSGTLWKDQNESGQDYYTYDEAVAQFGDKLPTKEQLEELKESCQWQWTGSGYKVTGPNGNSITLPAAGYRDCTGSTNSVGSYGRYRSSTPDGSDKAWYLYFDSSSVYMRSYIRCYGYSVRLVQD